MYAATHQVYQHFVGSMVGTFGGGSPLNLFLTSFLYVFVYRDTAKIKKPPKGIKTLGGFIVASLPNPFSWLSPRKLRVKRD
jgi:hypothetical protein